jgi:PAS domain S-box-containing protein
VRTRVLILTPTGRDGPLIQNALNSAEIASHLCRNISDLCRELELGAATALITEEVLTDRNPLQLRRWIARQPSWSDLPLLILVSRREAELDQNHDLDFLKSEGNITLIERPISSQALVSAVKTALRARFRQYEVQDAMAALAESEERYRTLAEALPQLVWTCRPDGTCDYLNRQWIEFTGLPAEQQLGAKWLGKVIHPDDREAIRDGWQAALADRADYDFELRIRRADGAYVWFKTRGTPIRDARGQIVKWFGTCTNISDIVAARELQARSRADLERLIRDRTKSLADANDRLTHEIDRRERVEDTLRQTQKLESIGQLTSGVAHDFNNLLTAVLGNIDIARRQNGSERAQKALAAASRAVDRGARLTSQLLAFSRKQRLAPRAIDINRLVGDAGDLLLRTMGATVKIETQLDSLLWPAMVDPNQIELVLLNLAINGRDAMANDGLLTIRTANVPQGERPPDLPPCDYVMIAVTDTGSGMSDAVRHRAFEPFFTTKEPGKGSGLGLSMVHGVAAQSGGAVYIDSELGKGTTVKVYLPRATEQPVTADTSDSDASVQRGSATVLVVDDDHDVREIAVSGLREFGYEVYEAASGAEALVRLEEDNNIQLVLMDVAMPGMNGAETMRRARERRPDLRAVYVSGYADVQKLDLGRDPLLAKPYRLEKLLDYVTDALRPDDLPGVPHVRQSPNVIPIKSVPKR